MDWVKKIDQILLELDKVPQFLFQPLDLRPVEKILSKLVGFGLELKLTPKGWQKKEECPVTDHFLFSVFSSSLENGFLFAAEKKAIRHLLEDPLLTASNSEMVQEITEGYLHYLLLESLVELQKQQELASISLSIQRETKDQLSEENYFCFELLCKTEKTSSLSKIYISDSFRDSVERHFSRASSFSLTDEKKEMIFLDLALEVGNSVVKRKELKKLEIGDFLLLDRCLYDPDTKKGSFLLMLEDTPIFRGKVTKEGCKLAEVPIYQEVERMDEDDAFYEENIDEEDVDDIEEEKLFDEEPEEEQEVQQQETQTAQAQESPIDELELNVKIELCRLKMNARDLSELSIGNLLPLDVSIDRGVDLVVSGKRFAKGELLRMGEHLGVRILEIVGQ